MTRIDWHEESISKEHDRDSFDCGDRELNSYLKKFARQNHESCGAKTFLAIDNVDGPTLGDYSVAPAVAEFNQVSVEVRKGLPRHKVPGFRLARLATNITVAGMGLGGQLLLDVWSRNFVVRI